MTPSMKNTIKYILQTLLGYQRYLYWFSIFKIKTLKEDKKEKDFFKFMTEISSSGDIIDIGANIGIMTYHLSKQFPERVIYSIEPMPDNLSVLKRIISRFKLKNVTVLPNAVGEKEEDLEMILPVNGRVKMQGLAHVVHDSIDEWNEGETTLTKAITIDNTFKNVNIGGIKMDIENFEYFALKGGVNILSQWQPTIYLELWDNENRAKCFELLENIGYSAYIVKNNELQKFNPDMHRHQNFIFKV